MNARALALIAAQQGHVAEMYSIARESYALCAVVAGYGPYLLQREWSMVVELQRSAAALGQLTRLHLGCED